MDILLQAATGSQNGLGASLLMMVAIIAIFYFFMIRPQQKKQKDIEKARNAMTVGDKIVTAGGTHGRIREVSDTYFVIEIADGVKIKVEKGSVYAAANNAK